MRAPRLEMQDVVLDDAVGQDGSDPSGGAPARTARGWWWPVAAGLVIVVGAAAVDADRLEAARLATLAGIPGILAPIEGPVAELWRSDLSQWLGQGDAAGQVVGVRAGPDGSADVVGIDPVTGEAAWRAAARRPGAVDGWVSCATPDAARSTDGPDATRLVACVVADEVVITAENTAGYVYSPARSRLLVVDPTTGAVLSDAPTDPSTSVAAIGADLLFSRVDDAGRVHVARTGGRGAADRWTFTSPEPLPVDDFRQRVATVTVVDGLVVVDAGSTWVLSGTGEILARWNPGPMSDLGGRVEVVGGGRLIAKPAVTDGGAARTEVLDPVSGRSFTAMGRPSRPAVDDGSLADLLLMQSRSSGDLVAHDLFSGRLRWTSPGGSAGVLVIAGRVVRAVGDELRSIDGRTGETVWTTPIRPSTQSSLATDGQVVLLPEEDPDLGLVLAAYGLDDGWPRWRADVADDLYPFAMAGRLYGASERGLVALG